MSNGHVVSWLESQLESHLVRLIATLVFFAFSAGGIYVSFSNKIDTLYNENKEIFGSVDNHASDEIKHLTLSDRTELVTLESAVNNNKKDIEEIKDSFTKQIDEVKLEIRRSNNDLKDFMKQLNTGG